MSLTEAEHVFAGAHEAGINDLLEAFFTARPRHLNYATPALAPAVGGFTSVPPISFPGVPGGIEYAVSFSIPTVDFHPDSSGGASPLPLGAGQLGIRTTVALTVLCNKRGRPQEGDDDVPLTRITAILDVFARGKPTVTVLGPGVGDIGFELDTIELVDIKPDSLESILECILLMILQAVLANVRLPFEAVTIGAFALVLQRGPESEEDQAKLYGDL
jgi:hypothetical protein